MNHCGQSPRCLILLREDDPQNLLDRLVMFEREQELDRPLADIARSPGGAGILLEPVRHGEMDHGIVGEPREHAIERRDVAVASRDPEAARDAFPVASRPAPASLRSSTPRSYLAASALGLVPDPSSSR